MNDIDYTTWKVENEDKYHILDINLYKSKIDTKNNNVVDYKISFDFIKKNLSLRMSTDSLFVQYLPSIYNFIEKTNKFYSSGRSKLAYLNNLNFTSLFSCRKEILQYKSENFRFVLKNEVYIEKHLYTCLKEKLEALNEFMVPGKKNNTYITIDEFDNPYTLLSNIIIPYKIDGDLPYSEFSLLKLFAATDFVKYFFKENLNFKENI